MTNRDVLETYQNLKQPELKNLKGLKLVYAIDKNLTKLESEVKSIRTAHEPEEEYKKYDKARIELNEKYAEKKEDGSPALRKVNEVQMEYIIDPKKMHEFQAEIDTLKMKYSAVIKTRDEQAKEYDKFLDEKSDFKPYLIDSKLLPDDIEWGQYQLIRKLIF